LQNLAVIRLLHGKLAWYPPGASDGPQWLENEHAVEKLQAALVQRRLVPVFAAPGDEVRLSSLVVGDDERKHLGKSLPFMLEEAVAEDIEELHFACAALERNEYAVAVCTRDRMAAWESALEQYSGVNHWVPEPLLLPWQPGEWCLVLEGERAVVRTGRAAGFCVEREMLPLFLNSTLVTGDEPEAVVLYGREQAADTDLVPDQLRARVQWRDGDFYSALMLAGPLNGTLNLLQGDYAPRLPLRRWWGQWRAVAALFAIAFGLQLAATYVDYLGLKRENLALRTAVEDSYRKAYPQGALVDPEKQLRRQLEALRGSGQTSGFVSLMSRVGEVIAQRPGTTIASINYNDRGDEMRMNIVAADYESVEQVRSAINSAGLEAEMESSSAQGDKVRARLRVGERS
jgi:general secretion pathway protein L